MHISITSRSKHILKAQELMQVHHAGNYLESFKDESVLNVKFGSRKI